MDGTLQWRLISVMASQIICNPAVYSTACGGRQHPEPQKPPKLDISGPSMSMSWRHNAADVQLQLLGFPHIIHLHACIMIAGSKSRDNRPISEILLSICFISHNAPLRTEICTFLFWMMHCGIWNWCIVGFLIRSNNKLNKTGDLLKTKRPKTNFLSFYLVVIISFW